MSRVDRIIGSEERLLRLDLDAPFKVSFGTLTTLPRVLLILDAVVDGIAYQGVGEASIDFPFVAYDAWDIMDKLKHIDYGGVDFDDHQGSIERLSTSTSALIDTPAAFAAVNMALDDLFGQVRDVPISSLYGSTQMMPMKLVSIGIQDTPGTYAAAMNSVRRNGGIPKIKAGASLEEDLENLSLISASGGGVYAIDFNARYHSEEFNCLVSSLSARNFNFADVLFLEQPTTKNEGFLGLSGALRSLLKAGHDLLVVADESFITVHDALECSRRHIALNYKIQKVGGIYAARKIEESVLETGPALPSMLGGTFPTPLARAYDKHAASVLRTCELPSDGVMPAEEYLPKHQWVGRPVARGGLGLEIDTRRIASMVVEDPAGVYARIRRGLDPRPLEFCFTHGTYPSVYRDMTKRDPLWNIDR